MKRNRVDSASLVGFFSGFALAIALRPWHSLPSGGPLRTSVYVCDVRSEVCHLLLHSVIAALRDMARTASMDEVSTKLGGGGAAAC